MVSDIAIGEIHDTAEAAQRRVVRHEHRVLLAGSVTQAAAAMDARGWDVLLFTDIETGMDAVLYRGGPYGMRLARQHRRGLPTDTQTPALIVDARSTPYLEESEAVERLCRFGLPFLFFNDPRDGRGRLLSRGHDGALIVVAPRPTDSGR
ncbi:sigma 54 modulation/S30EA ribosomal C-terminal domain-containing protein [Nocardia lijiangensis]|uniref:sigma 54 modulation/S30EA ribosomal C-terminal domain-containing protein n=1 Tax=Nocardia lijiangensis TaxID=299618 RepID=UPI000AD688D9|nr:sigma 54 modulation/S30EA ribosomal C-terminal domain-containing protein [Nocardia lijiangensis]